MKNWEKFENECAEYLQNKYSDQNINFELKGGFISNSNDIITTKNGKELFAIECKMSQSQCGQFVLEANKKNKKFIFSDKNKTPLDKYAKAIIREMNNNFELCLSSGKDLPIEEKLISKWVKNYYLNFKKTQFCITKSKTEYIIFPIEKFDKYFTFSAMYRIKKSGSSNPSTKNIAEIEKLLKIIDVNAKIEIIKDECYAIINTDKDLLIIKGDNYRYQLKREKEKFKIRRLSNTSHSNFIVSIKLKHSKQSKTHLKIFEKSLSNQIK